ncbi:hypothetical protein JW921_00470 [Candidatus Fermentibacterales bacterium]|nr:hypothetical protein [Candidatus Fermentibacterales bacterium]
MPDETEILRKELDHYRTEREKVRRIIGQIGGQSSAGRDRAINAVFLSVVLAVFLFDIVRHIAGLQIPAIPPVLTLEVAVLLVSLKIVWMIHRQQKIDHFQFWMLNSIEFQMNAMSGRMREMEQALERRPGGQATGEPPGQDLQS